MDDWSLTYERELAHAEMARAAGNEGRARVCARRAAGIVAREYLRRGGLPDPSLSAIDRLQALQILTALPDGAGEAIALLLLRVTTEHELPVEADLIEVSRRLRRVLLGKDGA